MVFLGVEGLGGRGEVAIIWVVPPKEGMGGREPKDPESSAQSMGAAREGIWESEQRDGRISDRRLDST